MTGKWFDGYNGENVILFDDVKRDAVPTITMFKRLCDGFPQQLPVKGGFTWFRPDYIYLTSNHSPENWWSSFVNLKCTIFGFGRAFASLYNFYIEFRSGP